MRKFIVRLALLILLLGYVVYALGLFSTAVGFLGGISNFAERDNKAIQRYNQEKFYKKR
ncbi:MAG: hypothetical protein HYW89_00955 [Candidatus Sungiibacteriota bacterium]|uniref:Uncharacterized protein n=1 Tax=Candidatus Sungiibacteriota bacterium TaxID=2750080 RepID=A0A7T5RJZ3_9BACT|nr:MAG: hypothetical protein HYW89_00955 [Candidatus Sungbacteria bacterium]